MSATNPPHDTGTDDMPGTQMSAPRRPGRALAARLIRLAGGAGDPADLPRRAAAAVLEATGGTHVSLWREPVAESGHHGPSALECVGEARAANVRGCAVSTVRAAAWLALRENRHREARPCVAEWPPRPDGRDPRQRPQRPGLVALPVGARHARASGMAIVVMAGDRTRWSEAAALLGEARAALDAVARVVLLAADLEQAHRRQGQLQAIFANSSEAILTVDHDFHLVEVNNACSALLDRDRAEIVGRHCSEVLTCQDERGQVLCSSPACPLAQALVLDHVAPYRDLLWRGAGDTTKRVSASFAPVRVTDGTHDLTTGSVITARDISTEKAASRMQANFISMVSHDLRTPLTTINGFLDIVLEGTVGALNPKQEEFLAYAQASTHQLFDLVEEVLFITRVDSGQFSLRLHEVDVPALVAQSVRNFQSAAQRAEVNVRTAIQGDLPVIYADETRLLQVLSNLINNALKFTPPEGTITVEASRERDSMRFSVRDTGEGVPEAEQSNIFERFVQLPSETLSTAGGYGLGLAIARMIVHQHGGRIWVRNAPEGGAIFTFTIPLSLRPVPPVAKRAEPGV